MRRRFLIIVCLLALTAPIFVHAAPNWWPIVPCGLHRPSPTDIQAGAKLLAESYYQDCTKCGLIGLFKNLIDFVVEGLIPILGTFFFLLGGFMILVGADKPGRIGDGKKIMWGTAAGIAIILSSWLVTNFLLKTLAGDSDIATKWNVITCKESSLKDLSGPTFPTVGGGNPGSGTPPGPGPGPGTGGGTPGGTCTGVACTFLGKADILSAVPVNPGDGCDASAINTLSPAIVAGAGNIQIASGIDTIKMLKAIIANESNGVIDIGSKDGQSAGPFQLRPSTAQKYAVECGVNTNIDMAWLRNSANVKAEACIAATYIKSFVGTCGADPRQLAAGYNGGGAGACGVSADCGPSAGAGQCTVYPDQTRPTRRWECLYEDSAHQVCNSDRKVDGVAATLAYTRSYAPKVEYCYNQF